MAEYIDREAVRNALYEADAITMHGVEILNQYPAADVVERPRWIPVTERLPKEDCQVLVYYGFDRGDGYLGMMFMQVLDYYARDPAPHFQYEGLNGLKVTHWMPLPPEPKEETPAKDINAPGTYDILYEEGGPDTR